MPKAFILFHLNLAYSSIAESARGEVIRRCYHPLLALAAKSAIPIGIELSSWTLRRIQETDPQWVAHLKELLTAGSCELIGSGYVQLIGPLVPCKVNVWNQRLGLEDYQAILDTKPRLVLVNEMAYSTGLVDIYKQVGYEGIVMDRDNVRLALGIEEQGYESVPSMAKAANGEALPVLWSDSILFQKLQRYAHGDIGLNDYLNYFRKRVVTAKRPLAVYCNDAEVFDYRPGRFREESSLNLEGEWNRVGNLLHILASQERVDWISPSAALIESARVAGGPARTLTSITQPIPVKKQAKYNVSRWAVTGRNDLLINTMCHKLFHAISSSDNHDDWRKLCELWASDLRTHITADRWHSANVAAREFARSLGIDDQTEELPDAALPAPYVIQPDSSGAPCYPGFEIATDADRILTTIKSKNISLVVNQRRGLTIHSLGFRSHGFEPLIGTIPHGYFESIEYGADYYSGGVIIELPAEHRRVTDLERVTPEFNYGNKSLIVSAKIKTPKGIIKKTYRINQETESLQLTIEFINWNRLHGVVRLATITMLPEAFNGQMQLRCANGGREHEVFLLDSDCDHTKPSSSLVTSTTGFGATTGEILIGDASKMLQITWDPGKCAAFPMLFHKQLHPSALTRLVFSLAELDETSKPEGALPSFQISLSPVAVQR